MKTLLLLAKIFIFCIVVLSSELYAQPANDNCTGATLISTYPYSDLGGTYTNVTTTGATRSTPDPTCVTSSDNNDDVWFRFVAVTQVELLRVHSAVNGTYATFGYALYDGCGGTEIACNNAAGSFTGKALLGGLIPGNTYYLRLWSQYNFTYFSFSFCVQDIVPSVASNELLTATALSVNDPGNKCISPQFFTTAAATMSSPNPNCSNDNDDDIWFQFTQPASNSVYILTEEGVENTTGAFGTLGMAIIDATNGLTVSCIPTLPAGSMSSFSGVANRMYFIRIWSKGVGTSPVTFSMCLQQGYNVYPVNDSCAAATVLAVQNGSCSSSTIGNLANSNVTAGMTSNPVCAQPNTSLKNDVWYKVTVPSTGNVVIQTTATHTAVNDLIMQAYSGTCGSLTEIACDEDGNTAPFPSANHSRISLTGRTPGEIIYVRVMPRNVKNMGQFSICAFDETVPPLPSLTINNRSMVEGDTGTQKMAFTVSLSSASADTVKVSYKTIKITAIAPGDYTAVSSEILTFSPGETSKKIKITIKGDTTTESDETFKVRLFNPVNATIADAFGKGTIKNDDTTSFVSASFNEAVLSKNENCIKIYPNPVSSILNIDILNKDAQLIIVYDMSGRIIKEIKTDEYQKRISINTSELRSGIYMLKIQLREKNTLLKFIKQ